MLGIIGAMEVEVATLKSAINNLEVTKKAGMEFCMGNIFGKDVVVVKSGIGKVNAAICTQILADDFQVVDVDPVGTGTARYGFEHFFEVSFVGRVHQVRCRFAQD